MKAATRLAPLLSWIIFAAFPSGTLVLADTPPAAFACPSDMAAIGGGFCMDRYEAPNVKDEKPLSAQLATDGEKWCAARGKRLCTEDEWVRACEGESHRKFPYGNEYQSTACNDQKEWRVPNWSLIAQYPSDAGRAEVARLYQGDPSGSHPACVSEEGVHDLTGNVTEWVVRTHHYTTDHTHVMKGCYWSGCYGGSHPSCAFTNPAHPGTFRTYEAGFRCCL